MLEITFVHALKMTLGAWHSVDSKMILTVLKVSKFHGYFFANITYKSIIIRIISYFISDYGHIVLWIR